jgi:hypothetical protein
MDPKLDKMLKGVAKDVQLIGIKFENTLISSYQHIGHTGHSEPGSKDDLKARLKIETALKELGQKAQLTIKAAQKLAVDVKAAEQYLKATQKRR